MPSSIDNAPIQTAMPVTDTQGSTTKYQILMRTITAWSKWFNQVVAALYRPQVNATLAFSSTPSGTWAPLRVSFPTGSVQDGDFPILSVSSPPSGTALTVQINVNDAVDVLFHNYSGSAKALPPTEAVITVIKN